MERKLGARRTDGLVALLWPTGIPVRHSAESPVRQFTLVSTLSDYESLTDAGFNSILVQRRSSSHFAAPLVVRMAGPLIMPWRWRRLLLNEGIGQVIIPRRIASTPLLIGALLAKSRVKRLAATQKDWPVRLSPGEQRLQ